MEREAVTPVDPERVLARVQQRRVRRITTRAAAATVVIGLIGCAAIVRSGSTSVLEGLTVIDEATWKASLPASVGDSILTNAPSSNVAWYDDRGISCFDSQNSVPCR